MNVFRRQFEDFRKHGFSVAGRKAVSVARMVRYWTAGSIILAVSLVLRPIRRIRFGHIYSARIGHLVYNVDNYLSDRRARSSAEIALFSTDERVANYAVLAWWKRQEGIVVTKLAYPVWWMLSKFFPDSSLLISWERELHPAATAHSLSPRVVTLTQEERNRGETILAESKIGRPYVCFHSRDSAYLARLGSDGNPHDFRDFDFSDMLEGVNEVLTLGYSAVRLGAIVEKEVSVDNPNYIDYTGSARTDFGDVFLVSECVFFVGCNSGFSHLSRLFRKPELLVNYIPLRISELSGWAAGSVVVPKKLYSNLLNRFLRIPEMAALPYDIHYKGDFFGDRGITVENNSSTDIANAVIEMEARVRGRWVDSADQKRLQAELRRSLRSTEHYSLIFDTLGITIGSSFLESNPELI